MSTQARAVLTGTIILGAFIPTPANGHPTWNEFRDTHLDLATVVEPIAPHRADLVEKVLRAREWIRTRRAYREIEQRFQRRRARAVSLVPTPVVEPVIPAAWQTVAECEASGDWGLLTSGNGYYFALQFSPETWVAYGGDPAYLDGPVPSPAYLIEVAERVLEGQGKGAWPTCGVDL